MSKTGRIAGWMAAIAMLTACHSQSFKIEGTCEELHAGDTLFLTTDFQYGTPSDTIIAGEGVFSFKGTADSTYFCMIYAAQRHELNTPFFVEPGTITMKLTADPRQVKVGGTPANRNWQELTDTMVTIGTRINELAQSVYGQPLAPQEQQRVEAEMEKLNNRFKDFVQKTTRKNIGNEFGFFTLTYYGDEFFPADMQKELISLMPKETQQRPVIQKLLQRLEAQESMTQQGSKPFKDLTMENTEGQSVSIEAEIEKHELTIIDFWASWCGPCRRAMPTVVELYAKYKDRGLGIIGISLDNDKSDWIKAIKALNITWTQVSDLKGWENAAARKFEINAIPHMMVVDKNGRIIKNGIREEELEQFIADRLASHS